MENILSELQGKKCWKSFLKTQCRKNKINPQLVSSFTLIKFRKFYEKLINMDNSNKSRMKSCVWLENELKAYQWFLVAFVSCKGMMVEQCGEKQWRWLSTIFCKEESILQYEAIKLVKQRSMAKRPWESGQISLLQQIIKEEGSNKWNEMARRLFADSGKRYFRSGKQCRERWYNHLDPDKKHGQWESTEDRKIATYILKRGNKWSEIAKTLGKQRTQHMVKNRLKTLLIKLKRKYGEDNTEQQLLEYFVQESQPNYESLDHSSEMAKPSLEVDGLPIHSDGSNSRLSEENEEEDEYIVEGFAEFQHQPSTPNHFIMHPLTPNFLNTPNSLTFLMNYSFDHYEQQQNLFLTNS